MRATIVRTVFRGEIGRESKATANTLADDMYTSLEVFSVGRTC